MTSHQKEHPYSRIVAESQDDDLPSSVSTSTSRRSKADASKHCTNGSISDVASANWIEPEETDYLLPVKLYGTSSTSGPARAKDSDHASAPVETVCTLLLQILVPFLLAGLGTVSAGILLELVQVRGGSENYGVCNVFSVFNGCIFLCFIKKKHFWHHE